MVSPKLQVPTDAQSYPRELCSEQVAFSESRIYFKGTDPQ